MNAANRQPAVRLLGGFGLCVDGDWVTLTRPSARVVALLGLTGHRDRDDVAATLWPDAPPERSHAYLRTALWRLNNVARGVVVSAGGHLAQASSVGVDARRLLDWATTAAAGGPSPEFPVDPDDLGRDLLPSWDDPWLDVHRERLRVLVPEALEARALGRLADGAAAEALWLALRAHQLDPLRESAVRILVSGHLAQGNRGAAVRVLRRHRAVLRAELGVDPSPDLLGLLAGPGHRPRPASGQTGGHTAAQTPRQITR